MIQGRMVNTEEMMKSEEMKKSPARGRREGVARILHQSFLPPKESKFSNNKIRRTSSMLVNLQALRS
jgi:hypothetical protein